jgi:biotin synthase
MSQEGQALCFMAGASSIFAGDKLLTTPNPEFNEDADLFKILGLTPKAPFQDGEQPETKVDERVEQAKLIRQKRETEKANAKPASADFEPRKITVE